MKLPTKNEIDKKLEYLIYNKEWNTSPINSLCAHSLTREYFGAEEPLSRDRDRVTNYASKLLRDIYDAGKLDRVEEKQTKKSGGTWERKVYKVVKK